MRILSSKPTCFYHPTKVIFLDDNRSFLDALELEFSDHIDMQTFTNQEDVMRELENDRRVSSLSFFKSINNSYSDDATGCVVKFEINKLINCIYDEARFHNIAVLVVDYEMPGLNGIEFCEKLKNKNIYKIMLTAEADKDTAIHAFNNGLIDRFILKTSSNLYQEIIEAISTLTHKYFQEYSKSIINGFDNSLASLFEDKKYQQIFGEIIKKTKAVEYYLADCSGSFIFLNNDGIPTWLIIKSCNEIEEQLEFLRGYNAPLDIISRVQKNEEMLFLFSEKEYKMPVANWRQFMCVSKKLNNDYYYSIVKNRLTDFIRWDEIFTYSKAKNLV